MGLGKELTEFLLEKGWTPPRKYAEKCLDEPGENGCIRYLDENTEEVLLEIKEWRLSPSIGEHIVISNQWFLVTDIEVYPENEQIDVFLKKD